MPWYTNTDDGLTVLRANHFFPWIVTRDQIECAVENAIITFATREQIECADVAHSGCSPILVM